ncbi:MAG: YjjG family noncanonical pyrimidine nucleotidase [Anaerolineae bacterium]|nr:YjjG family noncanonical pyrimidine nucleotidase [Anaerolineae bacterium]
MPYDWLLFDADGTLFDYEAAERAALSRTFSDAGLDFDDEILSRYQKINGQLWRDFEEGKTTPDRIKLDRFAGLLAWLEQRGGTVGTVPVKAFSDRYLAHLGECTDLIPDAAFVLEKARTSAHLALITNGLSTVQRSRLAKSGLADIFEAVVISEEEGVSKPDPGLFAVAFERMGCPPKSSVLMIGDSLTSDMRGANRYGIDACWFNPDGRAVDPDVTVRYEIHSLRELLRLLPQTDDH